MLPLALARPGETVTIGKITGKDEIRQHLAELGFVVDSEVTIVSELAGNLILQVRESRVALDKSMAARIMIIGGERNEDSERGQGGRHRHGGEAPWRGRGEAPHHGHGHHERH